LTWIAKVFGIAEGRKFATGTLLVVALLCYIMMFQGSRGIWEPDEGRYTNIALRMLQTGNFLVPEFNDEMPHFAKPPLTYWAIAGGVTLLGWNEWGARLPNALAFAGTVLLVFAIARKIMPDRQWLPPLIYATSLFPFAAANLVTTDTLLALWETLAVYGFVRGWQGRGRRPRTAFLILMWAGFGLAFLTKGPPGLLPLFAILVFVLLAEGWRSALRLFSVTGLVAFAVIGLGWYLVVVATHPGLATYFLRDEVAHRFASGTYGRNTEWYKGFVIYVPVLLLGTLPWISPLFRAARSLPGTLFSRAWWRKEWKGDPWVVFVMVWLFLPLVVFFVSKSRLPLYVLTLFVPIALVIGRWIVWPYRRERGVYLLAAWVVIILALKFASSLFPYARDSRAMAQVIASTVQPAPSEIVFVDSDPFWGLNLYLHCEVERVSSFSQAGPAAKGTLADELKKKEERVLFVADKSEEARLTETSDAFGYPLRKLGQLGSRVFLARPGVLSIARDLPVVEPRRSPK
jgi:4-amino-4-deoxy-L-arabinose transferase-like glycosyltransferase